MEQSSNLDRGLVWHLVGKLHAWEIFRVAVLPPLWSSWSFYLSYFTVKWSYHDASWTWKNVEWISVYAVGGGVSHEVVYDEQDGKLRCCMCCFLFSLNIQPLCQLEHEQSGFVLIDFLETQMMAISWTMDNFVVVFSKALVALSAYCSFGQTITASVRVWQQHLFGWLNESPSILDS